MNLLLIEADELVDGIVMLTGPRAAHLLNVLHVAAGSTVRVGMIDGPTGTATVLNASADQVKLRCVFTESPEPARVDLLLALPRPKVLRRLWAQLAALGVHRVMLTNAVRVERNYFDTHLLTADVYRPLLIEGLQQARDTRLPVVSVHRQLKVFLEDELGAPSGERRLYADPGARGEIPTALAGLANERVLLAVGPEGGWTDYERSMLVGHGFAAVSMGPRTLRSDTACVALLALVHAGVRLSAARTID